MGPSGRRRTLFAVGAAAVVLVVVGWVAVLTRSPDRAKDRSPTRPSTHATGGQDETRLGGSSRDAPASTPDQQRRRLTDLGDFASPAALRQALRVRIPAPSSGPPRASAALSTVQIERCAGVSEARDPALLRAKRGPMVVATIASEPVLVLEYRATALRTGRPTTRVLAVSLDTCDDRLDFER